MDTISRKMQLVPLFWKCWFSFQQRHMQQQSYLLSVGGEIPKMLAKLNHPRKRNQLILHLLIVTHSLVRLELVHPVHANYEKEKCQTQPCQRPITRWNDFEYLPFTRTQTSGWQHSDFIMAINRWSTTPYSCSTLQCLSLGTTSYAFFRSIKLAKTS